MKYKVLYRKYRPDNFETIIAQEYIVKTLQNSIIHNKISHAYIFSGPRGTGKTSTAKVFAKAINCLNPKNGSPCGECEFCKNFKENPDIIEIDAASNNGVDEIRTLIDNIKLAPTNGKYKVYIIDEVHMLTVSAFNALLLTLEEPPSHTVFILATTNIESVPITILSRCQRFDFQKLKPNEIVGGLKKICELENIDCDDAALEEIAYLSEGGMRDALSLLDQMSKSEQKIDLELVENQIKTVSLKRITELIDYLEANDTDNLLNLLNDFRNRAIDYKMLIKKIIDVASNNAKNIKKTGKFTRLNFTDYKDLILKLADALTQININVDSYTIVEMILLEFVDETSKENSHKDDKISQNSTTNEPKIAKSPEEKTINVNENLTSVNADFNNNLLNSNDENSKFNDELVNIRVNNCFVDAKKVYLEQAKKELENYLLDSANNNKIKSILTDSTVVAASSKNLILTFDNAHKVETANNMLKNIEASFNGVVHKDYKLIFLSNERWLQEKAQYIENIKNKKIYEYIEERDMIEDIKDETSIVDVFDKNKVEII